jgi:hypothetical protein
MSGYLHLWDGAQVYFERTDPNSVALVTKDEKGHFYMALGHTVTEARKRLAKIRKERRSKP